MGLRCLFPPCIFSSAFFLSNTTFHTVYTFSHIHATPFHGEWIHFDLQVIELHTSGTDEGWYAFEEFNSEWVYPNNFNQLLEPSFVVRKFNQIILPFMIYVGNVNLILWSQHYKHMGWMWGWSSNLGLVLARQAVCWHRPLNSKDCFWKEKEKSEACREVGERFWWQCFCASYK